MTSCCYLRSLVEDGYISLFFCCFMVVSCLSLWRSSRTCHPKVGHFDMLIIFRCTYLKIANAGRFLWTTLICLKRDSPKEAPLSLVPSPGISSTREDWLLSQERIELNTTPRHTLSQTITSPIYSTKGSFIFPKNNFLSSERPTFYSTFPIKMAFKSEF